MQTERYENVKDLLKQNLSCTATYGRTGVAHNDTRRVCLQHIMYEGEEILDHLWVEDTGKARLGGHETVQFELTLIKRKRPGPTFESGPILDVQAKNPVNLKIVKR